MSIPHKKQPITLSQALNINAKKIPNDVAVIWNNQRWTYSDLNFEVSRLANALIASGYTKGSTIGCFLPKIPEFVISFLGILRAGLVYVPINSKSDPENIKHQLKTTRLSAIILHSELYESVLEIVKSCDFDYYVNLIVLDDDKNKVPVQDFVYWEEFVGKGSTLLPDIPIDLHDIAYLNYTSGTTGKPKGAITTHGNIYWQNKSIIQKLGLQQKDIHLCMFPSFLHPHETISRPIYLGGTIALPEGSVDRLWMEITKTSVTCMMANQSIYQLLANYALSRDKRLTSLRIAESGGSFTPPSLVKRFKDDFGVHMVPVWGSTETTGAAIAAYDYDFSPSSNYLGRLCPYFQMKIVDEQRKELGHGEVGELAFKGPGVTAGYYGARNEDNRQYEDGWYFSQDLVTSDGSGNIFFKGRKSHMIKMGGLKVYPVEVENILSTHPAVAEVAVVGVEHAVRGEAIKAVIVAKHSTTLSTREVIVYCKDKIEDYKIPRLVEFRNELPRGMSGKVDKELLK
jgi:long-chain acyl-CoA synthetase